MLAADKLQLQSTLKQQATALKEKEFNLHHSNLMTVGTQAAVLAGLDITMLIEFTPADNQEWPSVWIPRVLKFSYYLMIISAFCSNMIVVAHTTALSVLGAGLALRGPDGSMVTATDGLYEERKSVFRVFGWGLIMTVGSVIVAVWLVLHWEAACFCSVVTAYTVRALHSNYRRILKRFQYDESETVDFSDIFDGPAAIQAVPVAIRRWTKHHHNHHRKPGHRQRHPTSTQQQQVNDDDDDDDHHDHGGDHMDDGDEENNYREGGTIDSNNDHNHNHGNSNFLLRSPRKSPPSKPSAAASKRMNGTATKRTVALV